MRSIISLALSLALTACAKDIHHRMPATHQPTGTVLVRFTTPARNALVTVGGELVADGAHTERLRISGVPVGPVEVSVAAGGEGRTAVEDTKTVVVKADRVVVVSFRAPETSTAGAALGVALIGLLAAFALAMPLIGLAAL